MNRVLAEIPGGVPAVFIERPNRFLLSASLESGEIVSVHVPDPGRLRELLYSNNRILLLPASSSLRKTRWSLLGAASDTGWILVNTTFHRQLACEIFSSEYSPFCAAETIQAEVKSPLGGSRFDFLINRELWVEVKGCTLKRNGLAMFPDAPTSRGRKHVLELAEMAASGMTAAVVFLVFVRGVTGFTANRDTDPEFAAALQKAFQSGVDVKCVELSFNGVRVEFTGMLEFIQDPGSLCQL